MNINDTWVVKMRAGKFYKPVTITRVRDRLEMKFPYSKELLADIKMMEGARWHGFDSPPRKLWTVADSDRNRFTIAYLSGQNPYAPYDGPLIEAQTRRQVYTHQLDQFRHKITRRYAVIGSEMGTGKTLAAIEAMEWFLQNLGFDDQLWIGPRSALYSVQLEFEKWKSIVRPQFYTYEGLRKLVDQWPSGKPAPRVVIFDEASRLKNPTSQRSQAARHLADAMRREYNRECAIVLMTGTPAPNNPGDWWNLCEVAQPGFIREPNLNKFKERLAIIEMRDGLTGAYPHLVSWRDSEKKCHKCGQPEEDESHSDYNVALGEGFGHPFKPSVNEVAHLYKRMSGLVMAKFKKDCLDLPEKQYQIRRLKPSQAILNAARLVQAKAPTTIAGLTLLRELSDGFQYTEVESGTVVCPVCRGDRTQEDHYDKNDPDNYPSPQEIAKGYRLIEKMDDFGHPIDEFDAGLALDMAVRVVACRCCSGTGEIVSYSRDTKQVPCPKEDELKSILDEYSEVGRVVVYGGFTGSVERCVQIAQKCNWSFIRVDGRGWHSDIEGDTLQLLRLFQYAQDRFPRVAFIGQPGAAGMGLNLTASPVICYYSNDFNAESRIQSEDRIHRPGMDKNRGATIIDLVHLPTDEWVLNNLKKKRQLQAMSLGQLKEALEETQEVRLT